MATHSETLAEGLPREMRRVREDVIPAYESLRGLPNVIVEPQIAMMKAQLSQAEQAAAAGDTVAMLRAYNDLSEWTV